MREVIILLALSNEWNGKTPEIMQALRVDRKIHAEAMQAFHKMGYAYVLCRENNWALVTWRKVPFQRSRRSKLSSSKFIPLSKISLGIEPFSWWECWLICSCPRARGPKDEPLGDSRVFLPPKRLQESMQAAKSIDKVILEYKLWDRASHDWRHGLYSSFLPYVHQFAVVFKCLKRFTFSHPYSSCYNRNHGYNSYWDISFIMRCIEDANENFGCPGKSTTVYAGMEDVMEAYMWVAEEVRFSTTSKKL